MKANEFLLERKETEGGYIDSRGKVIPMPADFHFGHGDMVRQEIKNKNPLIKVTKVIAKKYWDTEALNQVVLNSGWIRYGVSDHHLFDFFVQLNDKKVSAGALRALLRQASKYRTVRFRIDISRTMSQYDEPPITHDFTHAEFAKFIRSII